MNTLQENDGSLGGLGGQDSQLLSGPQERELLEVLADCKRKLSEALANVPALDSPHQSDAPAEARLGAIFRRYAEVRGQLALANARLVAHIAKRFRDRGLAYSDLLQEGYCGLLEAIDRFDLAHGTKLATYATWWVRQAIQRAVAAGAYPVRLSPRHLRQLAQNQDALAQPGELIQRIHTATRPTVSLDTTFGAEARFTLGETLSDSGRDQTDEVDWDETIGKLLAVLRPREQLVVSLRFGLRDHAPLSLSQVGKVLDVSKERVRQIQDRALEKLRGVADEQNLDELQLRDD